MIKEFFHELNIIAQCKKYGIGLLQCPQFLFLMMGLVMMFAITSTYLIGTKFIDEPSIVAYISMAVAGVLFIISFSITRSFERLAEASKMKSEFINIVSHQLRSPLSNLKWAIEYLMSGRLGQVDEKQLEYFKILKENNSRMLELVTDLLTASRIEQGTFPLKKMEMSVQEIVESMIREFIPLAGAYNVKISFNASGNVPNVIADPSQIKLVVENLMDNAIRYIKDRGEVKIKLYNDSQHVHFEINDNGVGIPLKDQKYIFQRFFRSENAVRHQTKGSGLGLFIARSIIENSGGKLGFRSVEGKGSTFWFALPIKK